MFDNLLGKVLIAQIILIVFVCFILRKVLSNMLLEIAIRKLEYWSIDEDEDEPKKEPPGNISIVAHKELRADKRQRIIQAVLKNFGSTTKTDFKINKALMGGMVIRSDEEVFDYSIRNRLQQSGFLK